MPIKLTLSPVSHLKTEMTRSRFTPCSKAPTLQTSSPDIPPDPPQHLLQVYVRTHLGLQSSAHYEPVSAEQLEHFREYVSPSPTHTGKPGIHSLWDETDLMMNARRIMHVKIKAKGFTATSTAVLLPQPRSRSPVLPPCLFRITSSDIKHQLTCRQSTELGINPVSQASQTTTLLFELQTHFSHITCNSSALFPSPPTPLDSWLYN